jgi:hypothetical protein
MSYGLFVLSGWHESGIYRIAGESYLEREQTWGRAVRASHNSQELGALLIWGRFLPLPPSDPSLDFSPYLLAKNYRFGARTRLG